MSLEKRGNHQAGPSEVETTRRVTNSVSSEPSTTGSGNNGVTPVEVSPPTTRSWGTKSQRRECARMAEIYKRCSRDEAGTKSVVEWDRPPVGTYNCLISPRGPTLIAAGKSGRFRMVICEAPTGDNAHSLALYLKRRFGVTELVRVSSDNDARYPREAFEDLSIGVHDLPFADGSAPPDDVVEAFLEILDSSLYHKRNMEDNCSPPCVAIHCISGLGRSPAMVALGLIEREKMEPSEAIFLVRKLRNARCFTKEQSAYLLNYVPMHKKRNQLLACLRSLFTRRPVKGLSAEASPGINLTRADTSALISQ